MNNESKLPAHLYRQPHQTTVTERGQITLPIAIRRALKIERGTLVAVSVIGDDLQFQVERRAAAPA